MYKEREGVGHFWAACLARLKEENERGERGRAHKEREGSWVACLARLKEANERGEWGRMRKKREGRWATSGLLA